MLAVACGHAAAVSVSPMVLRNLEDRLERLVEGTFARIFRTGLQPVEVGRRLVKLLDANRTLDVRGRAIGPNRFVVEVSPQDHERFAQIQESLISELRATVRSHAQDGNVRFMGPVLIELVEAEDLRVGMFRVDPRFDETSTEAVPPSFIELPDGRRIALGKEPATIGRLPESTVVLTDPNASRHHAELRADGDSYELVDLDSTNGSKVNGSKVHRQLLADGDLLTFGTITIAFRQL